MSYLRQFRLGQVQPHMRRRPTLEELEAGGGESPAPDDGASPTDAADAADAGTPAGDDTPPTEPVEEKPAEPEKITFEDPADLNISRVLQAEQDIRDEARRVSGDEEHIAALSEDQRQIELTQLSDAAEATAEALQFLAMATREGMGNVHMTAWACKVNTRSRQRAGLRSQVLPSVESICSVYDGPRQMRAIQEGLFDTIREIWDAVWGLIRRGWEWLVNFVKNLFSRAGQQAVAMRSLMSQIKANRRKHGTEGKPDDLDPNRVKGFAHMRVEESVYLPLSIDGSWPGQSTAGGSTGDQMLSMLALFGNVVTMHRHLLNVVDSDLMDQIEKAHAQRLVNLKAVATAATTGGTAQLAVLPPIKFAPNDFYLLKPEDLPVWVYVGGSPVATDKELSGVKAPDDYVWVRSVKMLGDVQMAFMVPEEHVKAKGHPPQAPADQLFTQLANWDIRLVTSPKTPINDGMTPYYATKDMEECTEAVMLILDELELMSRNASKLNKIKDLFGEKIEAMRKEADELNNSFGQLDQAGQMKMAHMPLMVQYNREAAKTLSGLSKAVNNYYMGIGTNVRQTCSAWGQYLSLLRRYEERL